jgi:hypothetical protein
VNTHGGENGGSQGNGVGVAHGGLGPIGGDCVSLHGSPHGGDASGPHGGAGTAQSSPIDARTGDT